MLYVTSHKHTLYGVGLLQRGGSRAWSGGARRDASAQARRASRLRALTLRRTLAGTDTRKYNTLLLLLLYIFLLFLIGLYNRSDASTYHPVRVFQE